MAEVFCPWAAATSIVPYIHYNNGYMKYLRPKWGRHAARTLSDETGPFFRTRRSRIVSRAVSPGICLVFLQALFY